MRVSKKGRGKLSSGPKRQPSRISHDHELRPLSLHSEPDDRARPEHNDSPATVQIVIPPSHTDAAHSTAPSGALEGLTTTDATRLSSRLLTKRSTTLQDPQNSCSGERSHTSFTRLGSRPFTCVFCLESHVNSLVAVLCGHVFHRACLEEYVKRTYESQAQETQLVRVTCPSCRAACVGYADKSAADHTQGPVFTLEPRQAWTIDMEGVRLYV
ncbi:uncharacterized protein AKAW2_31515S [Aspergillus luchuensis]|uniref:RING-type domain-containing protein n=1 Tax=Aspergillus kawachii TaxID=1069201 RepID=A0A7R7ZYJ2_ASPKA|nr:uncharacterized protein AKAW2_31515S [Aspergillus luchuensis]BCR98196.1 hypothetical protein AKAW2_31515S [Aspergillus luchuensis]